MDSGFLASDRGGCHKYFLFFDWKEETRRVWILSGACALSFRGWENLFPDFMVQKKKTARELFFWAFVFWNAAVLNVPLPPPVRRTHQFYKPWSDLVSPLKAFIIFYFILSTYLFIFLLPVSGLFCSLSLEIKEPQAVILASPGRSVPLPKACTTLLGTTDLSFFVRVIPPFCVNYPLLTYLHQRLFLISVLFCLLNSQIERGPISCCHSRIIYT